MYAAIAAGVWLALVKRLHHPKFEAIILPVNCMLDSMATTPQVLTAFRVLFRNNGEFDLSGIANRALCPR